MIMRDGDDSIRCRSHPASECIRLAELQQLSTANPPAGELRLLEKTALL